jgi:hypothetical protein
MDDGESGGGGIEESGSRDATGAAAAVEDSDFAQHGGFWMGLIDVGVEWDSRCAGDIAIVAVGDAEETR